MRASCEDLQSIEGIGEKTADRIRWAISENMALYYDKTELTI